MYLWDAAQGVGILNILGCGFTRELAAFQQMAQGPKNVLKNCFANPTVSHNALIGSQGGWPDGNFYAGDASSVVEGLEEGKSGNYRVCRGKTSGKGKKAFQNVTAQIAKRGSLVSGLGQ